MAPLCPLTVSILQSFVSGEGFEDCWVSGGRRSTCCYGGSSWRDCFDEIERCCTVTAHLGPFETFMRKLPASSANLLQQVLAFSRKRLEAPAAAMYLVHKCWRYAQTHLDAARNYTLQGELPRMEMAFAATLTYFVSLHALHRSVQTGMQGMLRREVRLWSAFTSIYTVAWGIRDYCRCVESAEFYARSGSHLVQTGIGNLHFPRVLLNGSLWEHQALSLQDCRKEDEISLSPEALIGIASSSQCIPGDLSTLITLLHSCILEKEIAKVLSLHESIFQLATFAQDCLDTKMWGFSVRDAALYHAKLVWHLLQREKDGELPAEISFDARLQKRIAWARTSSLFRQAHVTTAGVPGSLPWHLQCGPHILQQTEILPLQDPADGLHGSLCTELGRFWLYLNHRKRPETEQLSGTLMVVPITMSWEANPWHHLHWWLPLIYYAKVFLDLDPSEVDVALVFPQGDIDFAISTAKGRNLPIGFKGHTEPSTWSILQHDFPFKTETAMMHWSPTGIHAGLLKWISDRPAKALVKYYGQSYKKVILGLPSIRSFLQTPQLYCSSLAHVKRWIHQFTETPATGEGGALRLAVLQRPETDGRRIQNYEEVLEVVSKFAPELVVKEVKPERLAHGTSWLEQFRQFHDADILLAVAGAGLAWLWALPEGSAVVELRSQSSPAWLQCSDLWNADVTQLFGGLARLAGIHHLCTRPHDMTGTLTEGRLSKIGDMTDDDAYDHRDNVYIWPPKAEKILYSAISMVRGESLPCLGYHWWL